MKTVINLVKKHKIIFGVVGVAVQCAELYSAYRIGKHRGEQSGAEAMMNAAAMYHPEFPKEFMDMLERKERGASNVQKHG